MIKKCITTILLIVIVGLLLISSWKYTSNKIRIFPDTIGSQGVEIQKRDGYKINFFNKPYFNHPYEMIETDIGYDLIIHFVEE